MFTINHNQARSIRMKSALNNILGGMNDEILVNEEVSLTREHGHKLIALYKNQEIEISTSHIERGFWVVLSGTDTAKSRVLDALNTLA